jgi:hypothetical protein
MTNNPSKLNITRRPSRQLTISKFSKGVNAKLDHMVLPIDVAEYSYNFEFDSGVLRQGIGISESDVIPINPVGSAVMSVWMYIRRVPELHNYVMLATQEGQVYCREIGVQQDFVLLQGITLTSRPNAVVYRLNGEDVIIITTPTDGMYTWDGVRAVNKIESVPLITSMTIHFERMFVTTADHPDAVWFSEDLDPTNFGTDLNQGGFVELIDERGAPKTALSYLNYVYIFREYGITRLTAFGGQEEFGASNLFVSSGRIYPSTVVLCGDSVIFLASDGVYMFDGMSTTRILDNLTRLIVPSPDATAVFANGKYYLALKMQLGDESNNYDTSYNNALIVLDVTTGNYTISYGMSIAQLSYWSMYNQVVVVLTDGRVGAIAHNGSLYQEPLPKLWRVGITDLDAPSQIKNIRQLDIYSRHDIQLLFRTDRTTKLVSVNGSNTTIRLRLNLQCRLFGMDILSHVSDAYISRPSIKVVLT